MIHVTPTLMNTNKVVHSSRLSGPIFFSSLAAKSGASGVLVISGFRIRYEIHGTTAHDSRPGTMAATNQLAHVTWMLASVIARSAPSRLLAWPVRNMAHATAEP